MQYFLTIFNTFVAVFNVSVCDTAEINRIVTKTIKQIKFEMYQVQKWIQSQDQFSLGNIKTFLCIAIFWQQWPWCHSAVIYSSIKMASVFNINMKNCFSFFKCLGVHAWEGEVNILKMCFKLKKFLFSACNRCVFGINPQSGSKSAKENRGKKNSISPGVLRLVNKIKDFEFRTEWNVWHSLAPLLKDDSPCSFCHHFGSLLNIWLKQTISFYAEAGCIGINYQSSSFGKQDVQHWIAKPSFHKRSQNVL